MVSPCQVDTGDQVVTSSPPHRDVSSGAGPAWLHPGVEATPPYGGGGAGGGGAVMVVPEEAGAGPPYTLPSVAVTKRRKRYTMFFKQEVLDAFDFDPSCGGNQRAISKKFGIDRRQVQSWLMFRRAIRAMVDAGLGDATTLGQAGGFGLRYAHAGPQVASLDLSLAPARQDMPVDMRVWAGGSRLPPAPTQIFGTP